MKSTPSIVLALTAAVMAGCADRKPQLSADQQKLAQQARVIGMVNDINQCREAVKRNPNDADAHMCIAEDSIGHNNPEAVQELRTVVRLQPDNRKAKFLLAQTLVKVGQRGEAKAVYQQLAPQSDLWGKAAQRNLQHLTSS